MSTSTSRKLPAEVLAHPEVVALVELGKATGQVSAGAVRDTSEAAAISPQHLKALLRFLSEEGVTVVLSGDDAAGRKKVAAAASSRTTVKASTAKKAAAKKAPAKKAAAKTAEPDEAPEAAPAKPAAKTTRKSAAKKVAETVEVEGNGVAAPVVGPDGKKVLPDIPDEIFEKDLAKDPTLKEDEKQGFVISPADDTDEPEQQVMVAGATADPVKDYLKQIGKVPLLNAEMEVEL
ncbi:MAG TPA: sigma-70 factor domain-containing protein, partial [Pedococcus sp.]|nr:sigma-70 factor domain-containing protein [Pedococcus sp.]